MNDSSLPADLAELARAYGVATDYWDWQGEHVSVPAATVRAVLSALGVDASDDAATRGALEDVPLRSWRRRVPAVRVVTEGDSTTIPVHVPHGDAVRV